MILILIILSFILLVPFVLVLGCSFLLFLPLVYFYITNYSYTYWQRRGVCQEKPKLFAGNWQGIGATYHFSDIIQRLYGKFKGQGPFGGYYVYLKKYALITDLDLIKRILITDFQNFQDRGLYHNVRDDPLTGNLVKLDGEEWHNMRTILTPAFSITKVKQMFNTVLSVAEEFSEIVGAAAFHDADNVLEIKDLCARFAIDVIGSCAFGIECNSLQNPRTEFRLQAAAIFRQRRHRPMVEQFMVANPKLSRALKMKEFPDQVADFFVKLVRDTVKYRLENQIKRNDFMDLLIKMSSESDLTLEQMAAQAFVFFFAGYDTVSITMTFCLYELAKDQSIQQKVHDEINEKMQENNGVLSYELIESLKYLDLVVAETLRLYPVFPYIVRKTKNDYSAVNNSNYIIEKGISVVIPVHAIHHDPAYYARPDEFDPLRFEQAAKESRHSCAYMPFGAGPRNCIAMKFAQMQIKVALASILAQYGFECCSSTELPKLETSKRVFLIYPKNNVYLKVKHV